MFVLKEYCSEVRGPKACGMQSEARRQGPGAAAHRRKHKNTALHSTIFQRLQGKPSLTAGIMSLVLRLAFVLYVALASAAASQQPLTAEQPRYKLGDAIPVSCLNRTGYAHLCLLIRYHLTSHAGTASMSSTNLANYNTYPFQPVTRRADR